MRNVGSLWKCLRKSFTSFIHSFNCSFMTICSTHVNEAHYLFRFFGKNSVECHLKMWSRHLRPWVERWRSSSMTACTVFTFVSVSDVCRPPPTSFHTTSSNFGMSPKYNLCSFWSETSLSWFGGEWNGYVMLAITLTQHSLPKSNGTV